MKNKIFKNKLSLSILLTIILFIQLTSISATVETLGVFKQNTCIGLIQTCGTCTFNNITSVTSPNSTILISSTVMSKSGTEYTVSFCNTSELGTYIVNGVGDLDGVNTVWAYDFNVTTTGNNNNNTIPLFLALGGFIVLIFAFIFKNHFMGFMSGILFIVLGIYIIVYGLGFASDFYTISIGYITIGMGLFIFLASSYSAINATGVNLFGKEDGGDDDF